ncbi:alpha/beta hydrolase [Streptomyces sp. NPDC050147]|uniref:alpha/beta fold hydrolase n=1 Tax=Streptomyces sp. NPDC050147 TaxID=3155513 RepID=UPI003439E463
MGNEERVTSADGTSIAFERRGDGAPLILIAAALQGRAAYRPLAEQLSRHFTVFIYDRRGRGESGDTVPYAVEREIDDLRALMVEAGGTASLYGHSSGAALVLHAAARRLSLDNIVLHEPPFGSGSAAEQRAERKEAEKIEALLSQGRRGEAIELFLAPMGLPPEVLAHMSQDPAMLANSPTLLHDPFEVMSAHSRGGRSPTEQAGSVSCSALVLAGGASPEWMIDAARTIADALPAGHFRLLEGQEHVVSPEILAPVLTEFLVP